VEALSASLPPGWSEHLDEQGEAYYHDGQSGARLFCLFDFVFVCAGAACAIACLWRWGGCEGAPAR
jgi:hypothetical protein